MYNGSPIIHIVYGVRVATDTGEEPDVRWCMQTSDKDTDRCSSVMSFWHTQSRLQKLKARLPGVGVNEGRHVAFSTNNGNAILMQKFKANWGQH